MAFQIYDDSSDLLKAQGQPWETISKGKIPMSLVALREKIEGGDIITQEDYDNTITLAEPFLDSANRAAESFPETDYKHLLVELPRFGCESLISEAHQASSSTEPREFPKPVGVVL